MDKSMKFIDEYHILYEKARIWENNYWMGIKCYKLPFDMMIIQELIVKTKPDFILETGTAFGGSAMFYASICELMDHGRVITCDINSMVDVFSCYVYCTYEKRKKEKRLYLEERKIPITNMTEETETAPERERKQMMVVR